MGGLFLIPKVQRKILEKKTQKGGPKDETLSIGGTKVKKRRVSFRGVLPEDISESLFIVMVCVISTI